MKLDDYNHDAILGHVYEYPKMQGSGIPNRRGFALLVILGIPEEKLHSGNAVTSF